MLPGCHFTAVLARATPEISYDFLTTPILQPVLAYLDELIGEAQDIELDGGEPGRRRSNLYDRMAESPPGALKQDSQGEHHAVYIGNSQ